MVGLHAVQKGADDGNAAHAARLEVEARIVPLCGALELVRVLADELLIGGDDGLACVEGVEDELTRLADAAHHFNDDVDVGVGDDLRDVGSDVLFGDAERFDAFTAQFKHADDFEIDVLRLLVKFAVIPQDLIGAAADDPQSENGDSDFLHFNPPNSSNRISTSGRPT